MKDAYSFDKDESGLDKNYKIMHDAYKRIFKRCGLDFLTVEADPGVMGGNVSHEFMVPAQDGEDIVLLCTKCKSVKTYTGSKEENCAKCGLKFEKLNTIEVGHIFKLGTKYSASLNANFLDAGGKLKPIIMGCYGIGVSRLISAIIEQNHDKDGIIWPKALAPYKVIVMPLDVTDKKIMKLALDFYKALEQREPDVLFDDRDERAGVKFKDADLLGIPLQVIIGKESVKKEAIELKVRATQGKIIQKKEVVLKKIEAFING